MKLEYSKKLAEQSEKVRERLAHWQQSGTFRERSVSAIEKYHNKRANGRRRYRDNLQKQAESDDSDIKELARVTTTNGSLDTNESESATENGGTPSEDKSETEVERF